MEAQTVVVCSATRSDAPDVETTGSPDHPASPCGDGATRATVGSLVTAALSNEQRNPQFTLHKRPLEEQFSVIEKEFAAIEAATMNPRLYDFTTANANPAKNRYVNVLANEETIFPPSPLPQLRGGPSLPDGAPTLCSSTTSSGGVRWAAAAAQRLWSSLHCRTPPTDARDSQWPSTAGSATSSRKKKNPCYINANLMNTNGEPLFVASQAPVPECIENFLMVLHDFEISLVLMLTEVEEAGILKADRYWPADGALPDAVESFGCMSISKDPEDAYTFDAAHKIVRRPFLIRSAATLPDAPPHKVVMYQYVGWPDRGVPASTESFEELLRIIDEQVSTASTAVHTSAGSEGVGIGSSADEAEVNSTVSVPAPPILVHCSAGIGRTGTLIGAYFAMRQMKVGQLTNASLQGIITDMRKARFGMVQRIEQYMFLYMMVLHRLGVDIRKFCARMQYRADLFNLRCMDARQRAMLAARAVKRS